MEPSRGTGIPAIRLRTDATESAAEWNKMREAVISIYESNIPTTSSEVSIRLYGFRPIARVDVDVADETEAGVGITPGRLRFLESNTITTEAGDRNESIDVMPTLDGIALDADTKPRQYLAEGDHEAWVVFREMGDTHEAKIVFAGVGLGPGDLDRDEKAERLATFEVTYPGGIDDEGEAPGVIIDEQFIRDELAVPTIRHQFKVRKTDTVKVQVDQGFVIWQKGPSYPLVSESLDIDESAEITIPGVSGSIWLSLSWGTAQHSTSTASSGITLINYRLDSLSSAVYSFRAAAPGRGADTTSRFSTGDLWYEIAKIEHGADGAFVTDQIINGPIYVNELSDSEIS